MGAYIIGKEKKMKKAWMALLVLWLFSGNVCFAEELGNPAELINRGRFDVGFQWTSQFKQRFQDYDLSRSYSDGYRDSGKKGADFENDQYYMATFTYGIIDKINVFAKLGMVDGGKWLDHEPGNNWKGNLESNFVWAVGAKGKLHEFTNGLGFGLAAQYLRYDDRKVKNWRSEETGESASQLGWSHQRQHELLATGHSGECLLENRGFHPIRGCRLHLLCGGFQRGDGPTAYPNMDGSTTVPLSAMKIISPRWWVCPLIWAWDSRPTFRELS